MSNIFFNGINDILHIQCLIYQDNLYLIIACYFKVRNLKFRRHKVQKTKCTKTTLSATLYYTTVSTIPDYQHQPFPVKPVPYWRRDNGSTAPGWQKPLTVLYCPVLSLYLDERRGVQGNTSMRSRELPRPCCVFQLNKRVDHWVLHSFWKAPTNSCKTAPKDCKKSWELPVVVSEHGAWADLFVKNFEWP